jgi:hypothetical protein
MQGQQVSSQKIIAKGNGWDPDSIYDSKTGTWTPIDAHFVAPAEVFTNQGVPMTQGAYGPPPNGESSAIMKEMEGPVDFKYPTPRSESSNAPFPKRGGDPNAGKGSM